MYRQARWRGSRHARSPKKAGSTSMESATTERARLPGLDVVMEQPELDPSHFLERGPQKRLMVFAGRSHPELANRIAEQLGVELGEIELETFANGETYCRYG